MTNIDCAGLDVALNEATLIGVEVSTARRSAGVTLAVLTLPEAGPPAADPRVQLVLSPVGRVIASLRLGRWDDPAAPVEAFELDQLLDVVQGFRQLAIYGWEFFDCGDDTPRWRNPLSLDVRLGPDGMAHTLDLFQDASDWHLDLRIWFDHLEIRDAAGKAIDTADFVAGGKRWWDALHAGDPRAGGHGIMPLS